MLIQLVAIQKSTVTLEKSTAVTYKAKHTLMICPSNSKPGYFTLEKLNTMLTQKMYRFLQQLYSQLPKSGNSVNVLRWVHPRDGVPFTITRNEQIHATTGKKLDLSIILSEGNQS